MKRHLMFATALLLSAPGGVVAADGPGYRTAGGLTVYLGVFPAAMIQGHVAGHEEPVMHGGVPSGEHAYHVMAAVFDAASGKRIEDATVEAQVTPLGLSTVTRALDSMVVAGAVTYGNYFTMRGDGPFRIAVSVMTTEAHEPVVLEFDYEHRTR